MWLSIEHTKRNKSEAESDIEEREFKLRNSREKNQKWRKMLTDMAPTASATGQFYGSQIQTIGISNIAPHIQKSVSTSKVMCSDQICQMIQNLFSEKTVGSVVVVLRALAETNCVTKQWENPNDPRRLEPTSRHVETNHFINLVSKSMFRRVSFTVLDAITTTECQSRDQLGVEVAFFCAKDAAQRR
jgi:hypothetical protein